MFCGATSFSLQMGLDNGLAGGLGVVGVCKWHMIILTKDF